MCFENPNQNSIKRDHHQQMHQHSSNNSVFSSILPHFKNKNEPLSSKLVGVVRLVFHLLKNRKIHSITTLWLSLHYYGVKIQHCLMVRMVLHKYS